MTGNDALVHALLLNGEGSGREVGWQEINDWTPAQGALWIHLDRTSDASHAWLRESSNLEPLAADALLAAESRPRALHFRTGLLVILRGVNLNPGANPEDMVSLRIWVEADRVITVRASSLLAAQDVRAEIAEDRGPHDAAGLLASLANRLVDRMGPIVDDMSDTVDGLEDELLVTENRGIRAKLLGLRREAIRLRRYLAPQRDALNRLHMEEHVVIGPAARMRLREVADRVLRIVEELDELRERAAIIQDELSTRISEQMNKTMYVLTVVASILLPLSFVTGLLGINVGGIPGEKNQFAFLIVIGVLIAIGVIQYWIFKRLKWI